MIVLFCVLYGQFVLGKYQQHYSNNDVRLESNHESSVYRYIFSCSTNKNKIYMNFSSFMKGQWSLWKEIFLLKNTASA